MTDALGDNLQDQVNSPGAVLKRCREYHGISLAEAAEATKIGVNYLTALENGKTGEFASIAYLKGFLRIYSSYLGLNPDDMVRLFERLYEPGSVVQGAHKASGGSFPGKQRFQWKRLLLPLALFLLLVVTSVLINRTSSPPTPLPDQSAAPPEQIQPVRSSAVVAAVVPPRLPEAVPVKDETAEEASPKPSAKTPEKPLATPVRPFVVSIKVLQGCRVAVTIDGGPAQQYELGGGDMIEWKAENSIGLDISNPAGVEALLDGKSVGALGPAGKPVFVILDAGGIKK